MATRKKSSSTRSRKSPGRSKAKRRSRVSGVSSKGTSCYKSPARAQGAAAMARKLGKTASVDGKCVTIS